MSEEKQKLQILFRKKSQILQTITRNLIKQKTLDLGEWN